MAADRKLTSNTPDPVKDEAVDAVPLESDYVDPRLDNRTGRQRPPLETFPAKPQQVDGPDIVNQPTVREVAEFVDDQEDDTTRKGMASPGPHGLGVTRAVPMEDAGSVSVASERADSAAEKAKTTETHKPASTTTTIKKETK